MQVTASDLYVYQRPSQCDRRIYLRHHGEEEVPPSPYEEVIRRLGERHEKGHLATFPAFVDLSPGIRQERERRTQEVVAFHRTDGGQHPVGQVLRLRADV